MSSTGPAAGGVGSGKGSGAGRGGGSGGDTAIGGDVGTGAGVGAGAGAVPHPAPPSVSSALGTGSYPHRASSAAPAARPVSTTRPSSHTNTVRTVMFRCVQPCACSTRSAVSTSEATSAAR